jgi:hypothetical protein
MQLFSKKNSTLKSILKKLGKCFVFLKYHTLFTELPKGLGLSCSDCLWNVLTVSAGAMDCTGHTMGISKIVNSIILPLADNGVSLFCMSTYQGDFILVNICTGK